MGAEQLAHVPGVFGLAVDLAGAGRDLLLGETADHVAQVARLLRDLVGLAQRWGRLGRGSVSHRVSSKALRFQPPGGAAGRQDGTRHRRLARDRPGDRRTARQRRRCGGVQLRQRPRRGGRGRGGGGAAAGLGPRRAGRAGDAGGGAGALRGRRERPRRPRRPRRQRRHRRPRRAGRARRRALRTRLRGQPALELRAAAGGGTAAPRRRPHRHRLDHQHQQAVARESASTSPARGRSSS